jgi:hypothetical protein
MTHKYDDIGQSLLRRPFIQTSKHVFFAALPVAFSLTIGAIVLPAMARADVVIGSFTGTLNNDPSSNFTSDGFSSAANDAISGEFTFNTANIVGTFSATIFDHTSGFSFTLPAGASSTAAGSVTATDYVVSSVDPLEFPPTNTPFTATFSLDLTGTALKPGDLSQTAAFQSGTGSLTLDIPTAPGGPVNQAISFALDSADIPEPASITILGVALTGLAGMRRRVKR